MNQPLEEVSTERLLDEVISRSGGLRSMRERVLKEMTKLPVSEEEFEEEKETEEREVI